MRSLRWFSVLSLVVLLASGVRAQEPAKPGPEHEVLKKYVGTWDTTMKFGDMSFKGTATYKMDLGGLWLHSAIESDLFGMKFSGRGYDSYDPAKKKYVAIWVDSMAPHPVLMEGTYDKEKKTMTMIGEGPGQDGKPAKMKSVSEMPDNDTINMSMFAGDAKEPMFTVTYKRKK